MKKSQAKLCDRVYNAVAAYVKANGGNVVVAGGIEIQEWPGEWPGNFRVAVKCLGRKPELKGATNGRE